MARGPDMTTAADPVALADPETPGIWAEGWPQPIAPVRVGGIPVAPLSTRQWVELMLSDYRRIKGGRIKGGRIKGRQTQGLGERPRYHSAVNGNVLSVYARDADLRAAFARVDAIAADGVPIMMGAKWLHGVTIPDRAATTDLFHDLDRAAEAEGLSMFFLGATDAENAKAVEQVRARYPGLRIAGRHHGYFGQEDEDRIVAEVLAADTDILWVALGVPREDMFVARNLDRLVGLTWVKTCGGLFNFLSGTNSRAPRWMRDNGLEWLYRTMLEPRRLFWRYLTTNVHAMWLIATRR